MTENWQSLVLPEFLNLDSAEVVKDNMLKLLHADELIIKCDGSQVNMIDTCGLQLLLVFHMSAVNAGKSLVLCNPSSELVTAIYDSGAEKIFTTEVMI